MFRFQPERQKSGEAEIWRYKRFRSRDRLGLGGGVGTGIPDTEPRQQGDREGKGRNNTSYSSNPEFSGSGLVPNVRVRVWETDI